MNSTSLDAIVFGAGLAGSILADTLAANGKRILVVDDPQRSLCSRVAAGLINPIGGKRLNLVWRADTLIPFATDYYRTLEEKFATKLFHPHPIVRLFANPQEKRIWETKATDPAYRNWSHTLDTASLDPPFQNSEFGGVSIRRSGYLDTTAILTALHTQMRSENTLLESRFSYDEIKFTANSGVQFRGRQARHAIFCEGHFATENPYFPEVPFKPAKGVIGRVSIEGSPLDSIVLKGKFLIPLRDGTYRVGATYNWTERDDQPDPDGIEELETFLQCHFPNKWRWIEKHAGVRPATAGAYPLVGPSPHETNALAFNGFGSKGSLQIPQFAQELTAFIANGTPLIPEVLPQRFSKKTKAEPKRWRAIDVARHEILKKLNTGDTAIDATAGNGNDTLWLARKVGPQGKVLAFDIQKAALQATRERLEKAGQAQQVQLVHASHDTLIDHFNPAKSRNVTAIVFNLGYLPGGDQSIITHSACTVKALGQALALLAPGGLLSIVLYPGHPGGDHESQTIIHWSEQLDPSSFSTQTAPHPTGHPRSPFPLFVRKR